MARSVNVFIGPWGPPGDTVPVEKRDVLVKFEWVNHDGVEHTHEATYTFPNILAGIPLRRLRRYMEDIILSEARIQLEIDPEE